MLNNREKVLEKEHLKNLITINNLALMLQYQDKYKKAKQIN